MKTVKQRKAKGEQASVRQNISKGLTGGKKSVKSSGRHCHKTTDKLTGSGTSSKMSSDIIQEEERKLQPSAKIKLQLFPLDERIRKGLEKDGHNPFLELTLRPRKKISSVLEHLCNKWGSSSIATGELTLFPFSTVDYNYAMCKSWSSSETGISAGDVHAAIGSPDIFRLRYGWVYTQMSSSTSSPSLAFPVEGVSCVTMKTTCGIKIQAEVKSKELEICNTNEMTNVAVEQTVLAEPDLVVHMNQTEVENEEFKPSKTSKMENDIAVKEKTEEPRMQNDISLSSLLWSDSSNLSIGGLLSEASLQGRFNTKDMKPGGGKLAFQPTSVISDSLDAFISQLKSPQASRNLFFSDTPSSILDAENACHPPGVVSSILDAENTCHSFAFSKPSSSSKDFLGLSSSAFSELSNQAVASRPFISPKSKGNAQDGVAGSNAVQESKTDPLLSSGVFNNENSLGLSSIRWNDSLGPFDLPLTSRQIIKDDSISIGGFLR